VQGLPAAIASRALPRASPFSYEKYYRGHGGKVRAGAPMLMAASGSERPQLSSVALECGPEEGEDSTAVHIAGEPQEVDVGGVRYQP
jgi:hypothetical protein